MSRRTTGRRSRFAHSSGPGDVAVALGASWLWYAADALTSGGNITSIPDRVGSGVALSPSGTVAAPAAVAQLGGQLGAGGAYTAATGFTSPSAVTIASVFYEGDVGGGNYGTVALTAAGVINTGQALWRAGNTVRGRVTAGDVTAAYAFPAAAVAVGVLLNGTSRVYVNARTATTGALGALASTDLFCLGQLNSGGFGASATASWTRCSVWNRALSQSEVESLLASWGSAHGITIGA